VPNRNLAHLSCAAAILWTALGCGDESTSLRPDSGADASADASEADRAAPDAPADVSSADVDDRFMPDAPPDQIPDANLADRSTPDGSKSDSIPGAADVPMDAGADLAKPIPDATDSVEASGPDGGIQWRSDGNPASACRYTSSSGSLYVPVTFDLTVTLPDGSLHVCGPRADAGTSVPYWTNPLTGEITGKVTASSSSGFSLDTCDAGTGCSSSIYKFQVSIGKRVDALPLPPVGRRVTASWYLMYGGWSCGRVLVVKEPVTGDAGPGTPTGLWLAGSDSLMTQPIAEPFTFTRQRVYCSPSAYPGCGGNAVPPDDYALLFTPPTSDPPLLLETGQTGTLNVTLSSGRVQPITVQVLRAFQTAACDDYNNWAWWASGQAAD
jgi:hypothetical protein